MKLLLESCQSINTNLLPVQGLQLAPYIEMLNDVAEMGNYVSPESSINLPFDEDMLQAVEALVHDVVKPDLKYIFVIGIGGSNLGTKAVYDALNAVPHEGRELIFIDTNNAAVLQSAKITLSSIRSLDEVLLVSISKSGGTVETLANTEILLELLFERWGTASKDRLVVITDEGSEFMDSAKSRGLRYLTMPQCVGGRFSVFSTVGLFPLYALGIDINSFRQGAQQIRSTCLNFDINNNPAAMSALVAFAAYQHGQIIHDTFVFNSELESLGKWYRQLLGESIGKSVAGEGDTTRVGLVPTVSVGSSDLHSVGQLYLGGPKRTLTTFVYSTEDVATFNVPKDRIFPKLSSMISGKSTNEIMSAIRNGTIAAYNEQSLPFMEIELSGIRSYELGAFMQFKMIEMMYLGRLFSVETFNQPAVELYKKETKRILDEKS